MCKFLGDMDIERLEYVVGGKYMMGFIWGRQEIFCEVFGVWGLGFVGFMIV